MTGNLTRKLWVWPPAAGPRAAVPISLSYFSAVNLPLHLLLGSCSCGPMKLIIDYVILSTPPRHFHGPNVPTWRPTTLCRNVYKFQAKPPTKFQASRTNYICRALNQQIQLKAVFGCWEFFLGWTSIIPWEATAIFITKAGASVSPDFCACMGFEPAPRFWRSRFRNGLTLYAKSLILSSSTPLFPPRASPMLKASLILPITSGFNSIKSVSLYVSLFGWCPFMGFNQFGSVHFQEFNEYTNFEECLDYIEECMINHGPIDGLLGFSQVCYFYFPTCGSNC